MPHRATDPAPPAPLPHFPAADDAVRRWAALAPDRTALVDDASGAGVSYAALDAASDAWAAELRARGIAGGDRVALLAGTRPECVALLHGCLRVGAALVPLNWRLSAEELARVLADARPSLLVTEARHDAAADAAVARSAAVGRPAPARCALDAAPVRGRAPEDRLPVPAHHADDAGLILYTSGSTGTPKGVVLPRRQLLYNAIATTVGWELGAGDVVPVCTPLFHTGGWNVFLLPILHVGGTAVLFDQFDPARYLDGLRTHGCTIAFGVPTQLQMMQACDAWGTPMPRLRWFISGGAPCPPTVRAAVRAAGYGFREGYGLTECGPNCFATSDAAADAHPGTVGWPAAFLETRIADELDRALPDGETGELQLRGPQMFAGYFGAPAKTAEVLTADGWLRTGDLAVRDAHGLHAICGRKKDMYISGGENVFPGEVEAAMLDCPGVAEVAVIGVPDERWGEVGRAYVVPKAAASLDTAALTAHARRLLAGYKVPKQVVIVDALPRLGSGKIDRRALATGTPAELA